MASSIMVPVVVQADDGFEAFDSVDAACREMEAIDVQNGVFQAFDARGARLTVMASGDHVLLSQDIDEPADPDRLAEALREYLTMASAYIGKDRFAARFGDIDLHSDPLERLIAAIAKR